MYVLMVVPSDFPNGDAGAVRDLAFAKIFQELGYKTILIGAGCHQKEGDYQGIHYYSVFKKAQNTIEHIRRFIELKAAYMARIENIIKKHGLPSVIYINDISHGVIENLRKISIKQNIPMIHDSTEWYSPCQFAHGKLDKAYILKDHLNRKVIKGPIRVIGISNYLTEYFKSRGLKAIRIPVIMDVVNTKVAVNADNKIKLIYAGSPANKDYLKEIVLGTTLLEADVQQKLELSILGATKTQIQELTGIKELPVCIKAYGRVSREKVEEVMMKMDFSVLLRPSEERYTKAGFPTKTVEAMSHGVVMVCNVSSDLGMYLKDGENAIIVDGYDKKSFAISLERILSMNRLQIDVLKSNARKLAEEEFDYRNWIETVSDFIGGE